MYRNSYQRNSHQSRFRYPRKRKTSTIHSSLLVRKASQNVASSDYMPTHQFSDFLISDQLKRNIADKGYTIPTPIQDQVIPHALEGKDVIGIANTGTGKTGAFLIPLINKVMYNRSERILIIAPTRELAFQIQDENKLFMRGMNIFSSLIIGGASMYNQIAALRRNPSFIIGTPGRLKDLVQSGKMNLSSFNNIVLDEADRMMDMGFINDITFLMGRLPQNRHSLFFSATIPLQVDSLIRSFLKNPVTVSVKFQPTAETIDQDIVKVNGRHKVNVLYQLLSKGDFKKVIVFGRTKHGIERLSRVLITRGVKAASIHGNKSQGQRQRALEQFKKGDIHVLLATDVASRGLDIADVTHVINYDQPASYEDYVHRIGRTGRADKKGKALTFID